ncbi:MAG TPA: mechanosensitive ion channel family protein [Ramlibacter sp.]
MAFALGVATGSYLLMIGTLRLVTVRLRKLAERTKTTVDDLLVSVLSGTSRWLLLVAALLVGVGMLDLSDRWSARVGQLWFIAVAVQVALWLGRAISLSVRRYEQKHREAGGGQMSASATLLTWFLRTVLWAVILLAILSNLGVNITAFIASLGIGGVAVALAVQNILGDLFASLSIAVDKPFEVGDSISSAAGSGTVEYVGLKTTRIRSLSGEQIVVSNAELLKQPVQNYRRMQERRISFKFGVTYDTTPDVVEEIPRMVRELVEADDKLRFDRAHFVAFGDSSLDFEVVYYVLGPGYALYMDAQQRFNLRLLRKFVAQGIEFAFPTRTLHLAGVPEKMQGASDMPPPASRQAPAGNGVVVQPQ